MLERAMLIGYVQRMYGDDELRVAYELVTTDRARALRIDDYGFAIGNPANLVAIEASEVAEPWQATLRVDSSYKRTPLVAS